MLSIKPGQNYNPCAIMLKTLGHGSVSHHITWCTNKAKPLPYCSSPFTSGHLLTPLLRSPAFSCLPSGNLTVAEYQRRSHRTRFGCNMGWAAQGTQVRHWPECVPKGRIYIYVLSQRVSLLWDQTRTQVFTRWTGLLYFIEKSITCLLFFFQSPF